MCTQAMTQVALSAEPNGGVSLKSSECVPHVARKSQQNELSCRPMRMDAAVLDCSRRVVPSWQAMLRNVGCRDVAFCELAIGSVGSVGSVGHHHERVDICLSRDGGCSIQRKNAGIKQR
jgi:hypothetical protein